MKKQGINISIVMATAILLTGCSFQNPTSEESSTSSVEATASNSGNAEQKAESGGYPDWTEATHSNDADPDYDIVFPQNDVNRIDIVITPDQWAAMNDDMEGLYGEFGSGRRTSVDESSTNTDKPIYIETQVYFGDDQWYNVGMKLKGHSSLSSSWSEGNYKLPFKLKFDEYEDDYEELDNQRFYGFKKLSFSSAFLDDSLIHEKLATETFEQAGLIVPETAFYTVYVDYGEGSQYFGLYTAVENIDDTVIDKFGDDLGNVYEAEGDGVTLAPNTFDQISTHYEKKTNEDEADWSDIENLSTILNSDLRLTDTAQWKANLEAIFDMDVFLQWLAVNSTIQNWDTYGVMTHNFYLYNNPENGKLTWIPWDNNEAFLEGKRGIVTLTVNSVGDDWPLIRYVLDDADYRVQYIENVNTFAQDILGTQAYADRVEELHNLISPYVIGKNGEQESATNLRNEQAFISSLGTLLNFIAGRVEAALGLSENDDFEYNSQAATVGGRGGGRDTQQVTEQVGQEGTIEDRPVLTEEEALQQGGRQGRGATEDRPVLTEEEAALGGGRPPRPEFEN